MNALYLVPMLFTDENGKKEVIFAAPSGKCYSINGDEIDRKIDLISPDDNNIPTEVLNLANEQIRDAGKNQH